MSVVASLGVAAGAAALNTGGGLLQNTINRKKDFAQWNRQNAWNDQKYQQQINDQRENWDRQNAYNHPKEQMNRLRQAGLNPNMVYGKGADNTASVIQGGAPASNNHMAPSQFKGMEDIGSNAITTFTDVRQAQAQLRNTDAQTNAHNAAAILSGAQALKVNEEVPNVIQDTRGKMFKNNMNDATRLEQLEMVQHQVEQMYYNINKTKAETQVMFDARDQKNIELKLQAARLAMDKKKVASEILHYTAQTLKTYAERSNVLAEREAIYKKIDIMTSEKTIKIFEAKLKEMEVDYYGYELMLKGLGLGVGAYLGTKGKK